VLNQKAASKNGDPACCQRLRFFSCCRQSVRPKESRSTELKLGSFTRLSDSLRLHFTVFTSQKKKSDNTAPFGIVWIDVHQRPIIRVTQPNVYTCQNTSIARLSIKNQNQTQLPFTKNEKKWGGLL
jgi:hypothetical protein